MNPLYPLTLLVTFLHELSHALAAMITGGKVLSLQVNPDGSGLCTTTGGNSAIVAAAGYLGSIVLGNVLLRVGWKSSFLSPVLVFVLAVTMVLVSFFWFSSLFSFSITLAMGIVLALLAWKFPRFARGFLILAGVYSVLYILRDYDVGPSSDLVAFANATFLQATVWMWIWLALALLITGFNVLRLVRSK